MQIRYNSPKNSSKKNSNSNNSKNEASFSFANSNSIKNINKNKLILTSNDNAHNMLGKDNTKFNQEFGRDSTEFNSRPLILMSNFPTVPNNAKNDNIQIGKFHNSQLNDDNENKKTNQLYQKNPYNSGHKNT